MSMTLKTTKKTCCGLSVVFKITTRRSTIDVRKKSDLSRKNRTTGSPGHVRKIWDWPQPDYLYTIEQWALRTWVWCSYVATLAVVRPTWPWNPSWPQIRGRAQNPVPPRHVQDPGPWLRLAWILRVSYQVIHWPDTMYCSVLFRDYLEHTVVNFKFQVTEQPLLSTFVKVLEQWWAIGWRLHLISVGVQKFSRCSAVFAILFALCLNVKQFGWDF